MTDTMTAPKRPPMKGRTYVKALQHMVHDVADGGGEARAGEYVIGYAHEEAEGMYRRSDGALEWQEPDGNIHLEISVRDQGDDRFVPGLDVTLTLLDDAGREVGAETMPFLWHPWLYHYGRNWTIPGDGRYTLRVRIEPPEFMRHDERNGERYAETVEVEFEGVELKTGVED
ncbi:MAG: iron transporter [Gemmatimonadota bacterium]